MIRQLRRFSAASLGLGLLGTRADLFSPSQDTSIAEEAPNALHYGASDTLYTIGVPGFRAYGFLQFDLSSLAGRDVVGNSTLSIYLQGQFPENGGGRTVGLWVLNQPWSEDGTTWNSFGASPGVTFGIETLLDPVDSLLVNLTTGGPGYRTWTLPESLVQDWADHPERNFGLLLASPDPAANPFYWRSSEAAVGSRPYLEVDAVNVVPEAGPGFAALVFGLAAAARPAWRRWGGAFRNQSTPPLDSRR